MGSVFAGADQSFPCIPPIIEPGSQWYRFRLGTRAVGFGWMAPAELPDSLDVQLVLAPKFRGSGLARPVLQRLLEMAMQEGATYVIATVMAGNPNRRPMIRVLLALGFCSAYDEPFRRLDVDELLAIGGDCTVTLSFAS